MLAENGEETTKEMTLKQLRFSASKSLSTETIDENAGLDAVANPNPMSTHTNIQFTAESSEPIELLVYNQLGRIVKQVPFNANRGKNNIKLERGTLSTGLYFCKIKSRNTT